VKIDGERLMKAIDEAGVSSYLKKVHAENEYLLYRKRYSAAKSSKDLFLLNQYISLYRETDPDISRNKFLLDSNLSCHQFIYLVRKFIDINSYQALFIFHNNVNKRKNKPSFDINLLTNTYIQNDIKIIYNNFLSVYKTKGNMKLLADSFQRQLVIKDFHAWLGKNICHFIIESLPQIDSVPVPTSLQNETPSENILPTTDDNIKAEIKRVGILPPPQIKIKKMSLNFQTSYRKM
jgi:hypothetical protein